MILLYTLWEVLFPKSFATIFFTCIYPFIILKSPNLLFLMMLFNFKIEFREQWIVKLAKLPCFSYASLIRHNDCIGYWGYCEVHVIVQCLVTAIIWIMHTMGCNHQRRRKKWKKADQADCTGGRICTSLIWSLVFIPIKTLSLISLCNIKYFGEFIFFV